GETQAPVGLFGEFRITPRASRGACRSSASAVGGQPLPRSVGTKTGRAPVRRTISGKDTQYGEKSATASPSSKIAWQTLKTACLAPAVTITFSRRTAAFCSRAYLPAMASRSAASPATSVYLVRPFSMALIPARPTWSGVPKSGSPIEKSTTSTPEAARGGAFLAVAVGGDGGRAERPRAFWGVAGVEEGVRAEIRRESRAPLMRAPATSGRTPGRP